MHVGVGLVNRAADRIAGDFSQNSPGTLIGSVHLSDHGDI